MLRVLALGVAVTCVAVRAEAAEPTIDRLVQDVVSSDQQVRRKALVELHKLDKKGNDAIPGLIRMINATNLNVDSRDNANLVLRAGNALYVIGTRKAYDALSHTQSALAKKITDASLRDANIDDPNVISDRHWKLTNYLGELLSRPWRRARINVPLGAMRAEELREHIRELQVRIATIKAHLKASLEILSHLNADSVMENYHRGMVRGFQEAIPRLEAEFEQAQRLLAAKNK